MPSHYIHSTKANRRLVDGLPASVGITGQERMPDVARTLAGGDSLRKAMLLDTTRSPKRSEVSITIERDGRYYNIPSIDRITGKALSAKEAVLRAEHDGLLEPKYGFNTSDGAVESAKRRSQSLDFGRAPGPAPNLPGNVPSRGRLMDAGQIRLFQPKPDPGSVLEEALTNDAKRSVLVGGKK